MKTDIPDPWSDVGREIIINRVENCFEDSFVSKFTEDGRLSDSEQYLEKLYSRLKTLQGKTSKKDLVTALSAAKDHCVSRLITEQTFQPEEETELNSNLLIRHIAPHLQAVTASELIHLLKADLLQEITSQQQETEEILTNQIIISETENQ